MTSARSRNHADEQALKARLQETLCALELAMDATGHGTWSWDPVKDVLQGSPRARALLTPSGAHVRDSSAYLALIHPDDRQRIRSEFRRLAAEPLAAEPPAASSLEFRLAQSANPEAWLRCTAQRVSDRVVGILADITQEKRIERESEQRRERERERERERAELLQREQVARLEAEAANQAKDEFLALLGHELRNPLAPITTALHLLKAKKLSAIDREREVIERQVHHMVQLVDDLLDVARVAQGKVQLRPEVIEVWAVVARAIEIASPILEQRSHRLQVEVPRSGVTLRADPFRLAQVFANLLTNAAKYTQRGGEILVNARRDGERVVVSVADNGQGIEHHMLNRVFQPFVQGARPAQCVSGGLGLGLPLVRSLVSLHEGTVSVQSGGRDQGSTFIVNLPACNLTARREEAATDGLSGLNAPRVRRVLVVDDNRDAAETMAEALLTVGFDARVALDGPSALTLAQAFRPEVAILDIGLPVMDGHELARRLRELLAESVLLVALTGYGQDHDRLRSRNAGFDEHLVKPVDLPSLLRAAARTPEQHSATPGEA